MVDGSRNSIGATSLHWCRDGSGPAVVLVHGFPLSGRTWDPIVARLHDRHTCYTPDLIGLGQSSSTDPADYSSPGQARALQGLLRQLGVESYALIGNDTGGWIARELALIDRPRVTRLVLTNTEIPGHRPPWIPLYQLLAHVPGYGTVMQQVLKSSWFRRTPMAFGGCFDDLRHLDGAFQEHFVEPLTTSRTRIDGAMQFLRQMKFARIDEFATLHAQLTMPTLFVWGANDPTFPEPRARAMAKQFPNVAGFHSVPNAKLFVYAERADEVATLVDAFLRA